VKVMNGTGASVDTGVLFNIIFALLLQFSLRVMLLSTRKTFRLMMPVLLCLIYLL